MISRNMSFENGLWRISLAAIVMDVIERAWLENQPGPRGFRKLLVTVNGVLGRGLFRKTTPPFI